MVSNANIPHFSEPVLNTNNNVFTEAWIRYIEELNTRVGANKIYNLGGFLTSVTTEVGNESTGEDDLIVYSLQKNILLNAGDTLEITAYGSTAANANNKTIKLIFGSTELFSTGAVALNNSDWEIKSTITRISATSQNCSTSFSGNISLVTQTADFIAGSEDFTSILDINCTGEGTSNNDIIQKGLFIKFFPKA